MDREPDILRRSVATSPNESLRAFSVFSDIGIVESDVDFETLLKGMFGFRDCCHCCCCLILLLLLMLWVVESSALLLLSEPELTPGCLDSSFVFTASSLLWRSVLTKSGEMDTGGGVVVVMVDSEEPPAACPLLTSLSLAIVLVDSRPEIFRRTLFKLDLGDERGDSGLLLCRRSLSVNRMFGAGVFSMTTRRFV